MKSRKHLALFTSFLLFAFYVAIVLFILLKVLDCSACKNFVSGLIFEILGFVILLAVITCNLFGKPLKTGYLIPVIICTVVYTVLLDLLNFAGMLLLPVPLFILFHLILFFLALLIVMPMLVMGKR